MTTFTVTVEFFIDGAYLDVTDIDVNTRVDGPVTITRGRSDQQAEVSPTMVTFNYLDNNATFDGENPVSAYYRKIGIGTLMRVKVDSEVRAIVEIVSWEPSWQRNADGVDVTIVEVEGAGILRRIDAESKPLKSPAFRAITSLQDQGFSGTIAYWPCEEESDATEIFSPLGNASPGIAGTVNFGAYTEALSTPRMLTFGSTDALLFFTVPEYNTTTDFPSSTEHKVISLWTLPETSLAANTVLMRMYCYGGNIDFIDLVYRSSVDGDLSLKAYRSGALLDTANLADFSTYILDQHFSVAIDFAQSGSDLNSRISVVNMNTTISGVETTDTFTGVTLGRIGFITVAQSDCSNASFGQLGVCLTTDGFPGFLDIDATDGSYGVRGYVNESIDRINRLSDEEDIPVTITGDTANGRLAVQGTDTGMELIRDAVDANRGILFEQRDALSLEVRTRVSLYNQAPTAILEYGHISAGGFRPVTDDRIQNHITAKRDAGGTTGGSTAEYAIPDDDPYHWTTQDAPDGAGDRTAELSLAISEDTQLEFFAAWEAHLNSWREKRFKTVTYELASDVFDSTDRAGVRALDIGDVIQQGCVDPSPYIPYNEVRLMVQGYTETASKLEHTFVFNTTPADIYEVEVADAEGSTLANVIDSDDTTLQIQPGDGPEWSTTDEPYNISVDGQPMTVTVMTTATPAFIAAGAASYADNASVSPALPAGMTDNAGQLMICVAACRQTGSGTIGSAPTGWTQIYANADTNLRVFGRYRVTGDAAPTITTSGGAAGNTVGAVVLGFSGLSMTLDKNVPGGYSNGYSTESVNASAQNIAYGAYLNRRTNSAMLLIGIKDDDWTSVATVAGTSELVDSSSVTGNDMGIVVDFYNPGTPTTVVAGSFTVTGGASAVSNGIVIGLRPLQTATVTRNIAGVAASETVGATVRAWRLGVNGL